jgi:hypothetical protein
MLQIHCDVCGEELIEPGALLFGPLDPMSRTTNNSSTSSFPQKLVRLSHQRWKNRCRRIVSYRVDDLNSFDHGRG